VASESPQQATPTARGRRRLFPLAGSLPASGEPSVGSDTATTAVTAAGSGPEPSELPEDAGRFVRALRTPAVWVDASGAVVWAHPAMEALRVVSRRAVRVPEIAAMVEQARRTDQIVQRDLAVKRPGRRQPKLSLRVRVSPMRAGAVLVLVEDMSEAERLDRVRRDFVANVSHELKTPIGALSLLAEAVVEGRDDPVAVERFAARMVGETRRLTTLVNDLMDLSRLEGIDPLHPMESVAVDDVVAQACDDVRFMAEEREIRFLRGGVPGLRVLGVPAQLTTAVRNLLTNAVNYSAPGTKVAVTTGVADGSVTIAVTDQGIGIPAGELDRIFERFYRVDQARSRDTGGTGLGLSIVKHVCVNHGGHCDVWSRVGAGSTFTIRLPQLSERDGHRAAGEPGTKRGRRAPVKEEQ
jgi:two-component system sensor histidine kinase SenX3